MSPSFGRAFVTARRRRQRAMLRRFVVGATACPYARIPVGLMQTCRLSRQRYMLATVFGRQIEQALPPFLGAPLRFGLFDPLL